MKKLAEVNQTSITQTEAFYKNFENTLIEAITSHEEVILSPKLGKFILKTRQAYIGRNPNTGKKIKIPTKTVVNFKLSQNIKDQVKDLKLE
ncbi:MAG: HU family DNA-binding protein ['Conium maculatum' witches'-broom phytoplasma]|nr:HU family DNA-binding protein ['Conium maculatum' witches'-broom phytoplasma]